MNILMITWNYPPKVGGMEIMLSQLVDEWRESVNVTVIGPSDHLDTANDSVLRPKRKGLLTFFIFALYQSIIFLRKTNVDIIFTGSGLVSPISVLVGGIFRKRVSCQIHGLDVLYANRFYQRLIKFFLPKCDIIFANSTNTKSLAIKFGISPSKIHVINPGLDFAEFSDLPDKLRLKLEHGLDKNLIILSAGRLAKRKGIPEYIEYVLPDLILHYPNIMFLIAGDNPQDSLTHKEDIKKDIITTIKKCGVSENVRILGKVSRKQLRDLYAMADLFVLPAVETKNDIEGFGIVLVEAAAAGCPVVSTRIGGIQDAVLHKETGILVDSGDWTAMADAISTLLKNKDYASSLGQKGKIRAKETFDWPIIAGKYLNILKTLDDQ